MKAIGIILAGGNNNRMKELTAKRAVPALPVAVKLTYTDCRSTDPVQCTLTE